MRVSLLREAVFKVAAYRLDAIVKTSSPLPDCPVNDSPDRPMLIIRHVHANVVSYNNYKVKVAQ